MDLNFLILIVFLSLLLICKVFKNLMITLILLEILMINILLLMFNMNILMSMNQYLVIYFLIMVVCESVLILSMLVIFVRFTGNDLLMNKSIFPFK